MNKVLRRLNETLNGNKVYYLFVLFLFFIGIVIGGYVVKYMGDNNKSDLNLYLNDFLKGINQKEVNYSELLITVFKNNIIIILPIIIFSFTRFGMPIILIVDVFKGFSLGYTFALLSLANGGSGFLIASASVIPQNILYIPAIIILSALGLSTSLSILKNKITKNNNNFDKNIQIKGMLKAGILIVGILLLGMVVETYLSPNIIKAVISKFYM